MVMAGTSAPIEEWHDATGRLSRLLDVRPDDSDPRPVIIIVHGVNGLGDHIRDVARAFAGQGYRVVAPDLYGGDARFADHRVEDIEAAAHMGRDPERQQRVLASLPEDERIRVAAARAWISGRDTSGYVEIVRAAFDFVAAAPGTTAVGTLGYCMGGRLVGELAVLGVDVAAHVVYYGNAPPEALVARIRGAMQGHYARSDTAITDKIPSFAAAMARAGKPFEYFIYDAAHGFSLSPRLKPYNAQATAESMARIREFFAMHLGPVRAPSAMRDH